MWEAVRKYWPFGVALLVYLVFDNWRLSVKYWRGVPIRQDEMEICIKVIMRAAGN